MTPASLGVLGGRMRGHGPSVLVAALSATFGVAIFVGILGADLLARRRGVEAIPPRKSPLSSPKICNIS